MVIFPIPTFYSMTVKSTSFNFFIFLFVICFLNKSCTSNIKQATNDNSIIKIKESYTSWLNQKIASGEYWPESQTDYYLDTLDFESLPEDANPWDNCLDGLPQMYDNAHYGDINQDGIVDGFGRVVPLFCMHGTWSINMSIHLYFISNTDGGYDVVEEPEIVSTELGAAGQLDTILPNGKLKYTSLDYAEGDAHCCPSKEREVTFVFKNGQFIKR